MDTPTAESPEIQERLTKEDVEAFIDLKNPEIKKQHGTFNDRAFTFYASVHAASDLKSYPCFSRLAECKALAHFVNHERLKNILIIAVLKAENEKFTACSYDGLHENTGDTAEFAKQRSKDDMRKYYDAVRDAAGAESETLRVDVQWYYFARMFATNCLSKLGKGHDVYYFVGFPTEEDPDPQVRFPEKGEIGIMAIWSEDVA